jgi:hypothetical protein
MEGAITAEQSLRERLDTISQYQEQRSQAIAESAPMRHALETTLTHLDGALDYSRPDRVRALVGEPPQHLVEWLGPPRRSPAGQAVWYHHALTVEAALDRNHIAIPRFIENQQTARRGKQSGAPTGASSPAPIHSTLPNGPMSPGRRSSSATKCTAT